MMMMMTMPAQKTGPAASSGKPSGMPTMNRWWIFWMKYKQSTADQYFDQTSTSKSLMGESMVVTHSRTRYADKEKWNATFHMWQWWNRLIFAYPPGWLSGRSCTLHRSIRGQSSSGHTWSGENRLNDEYFVREVQVALTSRIGPFGYAGLIALCLQQSGSMPPF